MDIESILQAVQAISLTVAALVAISGITAWRKEFVGKKKIDLAEEVLVRFYEARDVFRVIRSPFGFMGEGSSRQAGEHERPEEKEILDKAYVVFERYEKHKEVFSHLQPLKYRFRAQFGAEAVGPFDSLSSCLNEIFIAARMLGQTYWRDQGHRAWATEEEFQRHLAEMHRLESIFWETRIEDDVITPRIDAAVATVEGICSEVMHPESKPTRPWRVLKRFARTPPNKDRGI